MHERRVGQLYEAGQKKWQEGGKYHYTNYGHELRLFVWHPSHREIEGFTLGVVTLAVLAEEPFLWLLCRFAPGLTWRVAPYMWQGLDADEEPTVLPAITPDTRALLQAHLVDAATGILRAVRTIMLSPAFTGALEGELRQCLVQNLKTHPAQDDIQAQLKAVQSRYARPQLMLADALAIYQSGD